MNAAHLRDIKDTAKNVNITDIDYREIDGELTPEKLDEMETAQLAIRLFSSYIKDLGTWIKILWAIITRYFMVFLCIGTYIVMLQYESTRMIIIGMYIFFAIFWSFFPYAFKCVMIYKITSISYCIHTIFYACIGIICWIIALAMYNTAEFEKAKTYGKRKLEEARERRLAKEAEEGGKTETTAEDLFGAKDTGEKVKRRREKEKKEKEKEEEERDRKRASRR